MKQRVKEKTGENVEIRTFHSLEGSLKKILKKKNKISDVATSDYVNKI